MSETPPRADQSTFDASAWLRENVNASLAAASNLNEYTQIEVVVTERGKPDRYGTGWDLDTAVGRAIGKVT